VTGEEKGLFMQRNTIIVIVLFVGILTPVLYYKLGTPAAVNMAAAPAKDDPHTSTGHDKPGSIETMVQRLEQKLQEKPDNAEGWFVLGRTYMVMRKYDKATNALQHAFELNASDPDVLVNYADALAMQQGTGITGKSFALVQQALQLDPTNKVALWLAAMGYEGKNDYKTALSHWQKLLPLMKDDPQQYSEVERRLQNASARAGVPVTVTAQTEKQAVAPRQVRVSITLDSKFKQGLKGSETVFVFALAANGPRQPLAARRLKLSDLPVTVVLDDSMAMIPTNKLSDHDRVYIGARVSRKGSPIASTGDIQGRSKVLDLKNHQGTVEIIIDQEIL